MNRDTLKVATNGALKPTLHALGALTSASTLGKLAELKDSSGDRANLAFYRALPAWLTGEPSCSKLYTFQPEGWTTPPSSNTPGPLFYYLVSLLLAQLPALRDTTGARCKANCLELLVRIIVGLLQEADTDAFVIPPLCCEIE